MDIRDEINKILLDYLGVTSIAAVDELVGIIDDSVNRTIDEIFNTEDTSEGAY